MKKTKNKDYLIDRRMDDLGNDKRSDKMLSIKSMYVHASTIFLFTTILYTILIRYGIMGENGYIRQHIFVIADNNQVLNNLLDFFVENILLAVLFLVILKTVKIITEKIWIKKNKRIWIKGTWLHIHYKKDLKQKNGAIRVGYVIITQNYDSVAADGKNYDYFDLLGGRITHWDYFSAQIEDEKKLLGFYRAEKDMGVINTGIHNLNLEATESFPAFMEGRFNDTTRLQDSGKIDIKDIEQHSGQLFLYRITDEQYQFVFGSKNAFDPNNFKKMLESDKFREDDFIRKLDWVIKDKIKQQREIQGESQDGNA